MLQHYTSVNVLVCLHNYVTGFVKGGLIRASNFSTLRMCNAASIELTALKFGSSTFLSLY